MQNLMTVSATCRGGRDGRVHLDAGGAAFAMSLPKELGGAGDGMNPEQLFAMGYASCFGQAVLALAKQHEVDGARARVNVAVTLGKDEVSFALAVAITVTVPGADREKVAALAEAAHQICPYSRATRNNVPVTISVG
ncbi:MAG TPA: Ohr family peroxiredoxin [Paracoccaceae bacterium]|nr:Ohr family peroxiredoxin [Paracoccaceae bacterium]